MADMERFEQLHQAGASARTIAAELGVTVRTVERWRHATGMLVRPRMVARSQAERDYAQRLLEDGCSIRETAATIGVAQKTIAAWFPDAPRMTREQSGHLAQLRRLENRLCA